MTILKSITLSVIAAMSIWGCQPERFTLQAGEPFKVSVTGSRLIYPGSQVLVTSEHAQQASRDGVYSDNELRRKRVLLQSSDDFKKVVRYYEALTKGSFKAMSKGRFKGLTMRVDTGTYRGDLFLFDGPTVGIRLDPSW